MKGQNFTKVAPHIKERREISGAIGTIESAKKRTIEKFIKAIEGYTMEMKNLCESINLNLHHAKNGHLSSLNSLVKNLIPKAEKLGIKIINEDGLTLREVKAMVPKLKKIVVISNIKFAIMRAESGNEVMLNKLIEDYVPKAEDLGIKIINEDGLTLREVKAMVPKLKIIVVMGNIKFAIMRAESGSEAMLNKLINNYIPLAEELGITFIDKNGLTLEEVKAKIPDLEKKCV